MSFPKKNPLCSGHLKKGEKCVIACLGTFRDFEQTDPELTLTLLTPSFDGSAGIENVDYYAKPGDGKNTGSKTAGREIYVISSISDRDKMTRYLYDCLAVFVIGKDKKTKTNISLLNHQDPMKFLHERYRKQFTNDLSESLREMKKRCAKGTIDVIIAGGMYLLNHPDAMCLWEEAGEMRKIYRQSILLLSEIVKEVFGFEPVIISGPKRVERSDAIMCVNKTRRMHIVKPQVGESMTESFLPQDLKIQEEKWQSRYRLA
ncbi:MAG: hypothetical protein WC878_00730 [Candidatus Paceibacterota bacterium]|jgi:hypothetical protein